MGEGFIAVPGGRVWWRSVGDDHHGVPVLCLHGGPGFAHDYLDSLDDLGDRRRVIFYDQLGCGRSDRPADPSLWVVDRFVAELVAVRAALGLERLHLFGSSWGGMLAMQYVLDHQPPLESLIIASSPASIPRWERDTRTLLARMSPEDQAVVARHEDHSWFGCLEYQAVMLTFYKQHVCRMDPWPEGLERSFEGLNADIYMQMQGPSEFTIVGSFKDWDITERLGEITVPTLLTGGRHDECLPEHLEDMAARIPDSRVRIFENGSHLHFQEERAAYMGTLNDWFDEIEARARS
jgi:proline iminopeptidase